MSERIDETRETEEAGQAVGGEAEGEAPDLALAEEESSQSGEEEERGEFECESESEVDSEWREESLNPRASPSQEEEDRFFNLLRKNNVEAVKELLATNRTLIHRLDMYGNLPIQCPATGPESAAKIDMAKLLLSHGQARLHGASSPQGLLLGIREDV